MGYLQCISTEAAKPSRQLGMFKETMSKVLGIEPTIISTAPFVAGFEYANFGGVSFCRFKANGGHQLSRNANRRDSDYVRIVLQINGSSHFQQCGRSVDLTPRQWSIYEMGTADTVLVPAEIEGLLLVLPRDRLVSKCYELNQLTVRPLSGTLGIGKLAWDCIYSTFDQITNLDPRSEFEIIDTISHLVRLTLLESWQCAAKASCESLLRDRIKCYVLEHLREPELSLDQIAAALNCSKRYLHKAFRGEGVSISDYIWQARLDRCFAEILNPKCWTKSTTDIAFSWGFNTPGHFSAAFKERFGAPPTAYRRDEQFRLSAMKGPALLEAAR